MAINRRKRCSRCCRPSPDLFRPETSGECPAPPARARCAARPEHVAARRDSRHARHRALRSSRTDTAGITLAPVAAALSRTEAPPYYRQLTQTLRVHDEVPLDDLAAHLESVGYERRDPVEMVGEYSIRGGILDVFSPEQTQPVRIEFFGDEIESIRRFDPESQRSIHKLNECVLQPLTEFQKSRPLLAELADHLREAGVRGRDLPADGEAFAGWELAVTAVRPRTVFAARFLRQAADPDRRAGADKGRGRSPVDATARAAHAAAIDPESAMLDWDEFSGTRGADATFSKSRQLGYRRSRRSGRTAFYISTRPSMAFHGNLQVAIREAKTLLEAGVRLAFFAPTSGEVERLADVFSEYSVPYQIDLRRRAGSRVSAAAHAIAERGNRVDPRRRGARDGVSGRAPRDLRLRRSVRIPGDRREAGKVSRSDEHSPPISSI